MFYIIAALKMQLKNIKDKTIKAAEEIEDQNTLVIEFTDGTVLYLNIGAEGCHIGEKWEE